MTANLERLQERLHDAAFEAEVLIRQSNSGLASIEQIKRMSVSSWYPGRQLACSRRNSRANRRIRVQDRFETKHEAEYGYYFEDDAVELLTVRVTAIGRISEYEPAQLPEEGTAGSSLDTNGPRRTYYGICMTRKSKK